MVGVDVEASDWESPIHEWAAGHLRSHVHKTDCHEGILVKSSHLRSLFVVYEMQNHNTFQMDRFVFSSHDGLYVY